MLEMWLNDVINVNTGIFVNVGAVQHWGCSRSPSMTRGQGSRTRKKEFTVWFALVFVFLHLPIKSSCQGVKPCCKYISRSSWEKESILTSFVQMVLNGGTVMHCPVGTVTEIYKRIQLKS